MKVRVVARNDRGVFLGRGVDDRFYVFSLDDSREIEVGDHLVGHLILSLGALHIPTVARGVKDHLLLLLDGGRDGRIVSERLRKREGRFRQLSPWLVERPCINATDLRIHIAARYRSGMRRSEAGSEQQTRRDGRSRKRGATSRMRA